MGHTSSPGDCRGTALEPHILVLMGKEALIWHRGELCLWSGTEFFPRRGKLPLCLGTLSIVKLEGAHTLTAPGAWPDPMWGNVEWVDLCGHPCVCVLSPDHSWDTRERSWESEKGKLWGVMWPSG